MGWTACPAPGWSFVPWIWGRKRFLILTQSSEKSVPFWVSSIISMMYLDYINTFQQERTGCWLLLQLQTSGNAGHGSQTWMARWACLDRTWSQLGLNQHKSQYTAQNILVFLILASSALCNSFLYLSYPSQATRKKKKKKKQNNISASFPLPPLQKTNDSSDVRNLVLFQPLQSWQYILQQPKVRALQWEPL